MRRPGQMVLEQVSLTRPLACRIEPDRRVENSLGDEAMLRKTMMVMAVTGTIAAGGVAGAQDDVVGRQGQGPTMGAGMNPQMMQQMMEMMGHQAPDMMQQRGWRSGMMGPGMERGMARGGMMWLVFAIVDADGDMALSLEEVQEAHARIFKHADSDGDGRLTLEELLAFHRLMPVADESDAMDD